MSSPAYEFDAIVREDIGKGASRRLRRAGQVPAVLYGDDNHEPLSLALAHKDIYRAQEFQSFYAHLLNLNINGEVVQCVLKDLQRHPYKPQVAHLDFQRVSDTKPFKKLVPIHFVGQEKSESLKAGGVLTKYLTTVEILCSAKDLPEFITIDVSTLVKGKILHLSDLELPENVTIPQLSRGRDHNHAVTAIHGK